jgi:hypothetical protein
MAKAEADRYAPFPAKEHVRPSAQSLSPKQHGSAGGGRITLIAAASCWLLLSDVAPQVSEQTKCLSSLRPPCVAFLPGGPFTSSARRTRSSRACSPPSRPVVMGETTILSGLLALQAAATEGPCLAGASVSQGCQPTGHAPALRTDLVT